MKGNLKIYFLVILVILFSVSLYGCGGGGGGGDGGGDGGGGDGSDGDGSEPQPQPQLILDSRLVPIIETITSDETYLYTGSQHELNRINKTTHARESLTGNLIDLTLLASGLGIVEHPKDLIVDGDYLYYQGWGGRIQRVFLGADGKSSIEIVVPQAGLGTEMEVPSLAVNDTYAYWINGETIYRKEIIGNSLPTSVVIVDGATNLFVTSTKLFILAANAATPSVYVYDILSDSLDLLQSGNVLNIYGKIPAALSATEFFWVNGDTIYRVSQSSSTPQMLVNGMSNITYITANDSILYALEREAVDTKTIQEVNLSTSATTALITASDIRNVLVHGGELYWISAYGLHSRNLDGSTSNLYINDGTEIIFGGTGFTELIGIGSRLVVNPWAEAKMFSYDIIGGSSDILNLIDQSVKFSVNADSVFFGSYNAGIGKVPADFNIRLPETLKDDLVTIEKMFLQNGWLYWSEYDNFASTYRISRMQVDGSQYEILFNDIHRGLTLYGDQLYFMCESACSLPSWTLVSMPLNGGAVTPEFGLADGPAQIIQKDGVFYVADTPNGGGVMSVYVINYLLNESSELLSGLPYEDIELEVSPTWLYRLQNGYLKRNNIKGWDAIGETISIDDNPDPLVFVRTMHSDANNLYYWLWKKGLKNIAE
jgi:hypothetical protein